VTALTGVLLVATLLATGLLCARGQRSHGLAAYLLTAYLAVWVELVVLTYILSVFRLVRPLPVLGCELVLLLVALRWRRGIRRPRLAWRPFWRSFDPRLAFLAFVVGASIVYSVVVVFVASPNTYDSLTYHLPRAAQWHAHQGWYWIPDAPTARENVFPPNAEFGVLFTFLVMGSDRLAEAPQLVALVGLLTAVYGISRRIGFEREAALFASLVLATLSDVALQATTTQTDLVVTSFVACAAFFVLGNRSADTVLAGVATALALGTKSTAIFAFPILALLAVAVSSRRRLAQLVAATVAFSLTLALWPYLRNLVHRGSVLAGDGIDEFRAKTTLSGVLATAFRVAYHFFDLSGYQHVAVWIVAILSFLGVSLIAVAWYGRARGGAVLRPSSATVAGLILLSPVVVIAASQLVRATVDAAGIDVNPAGATSVRFTWDLAGEADEDLSYFGPLGAVVLAPLAAVTLARRRSHVHSTQRVLALSIPLFVVALAAFYRYNPWLGRFLVIPVALTAPLVASLYRPRLVATAVALVASVTLVLAKVYDRYQPATVGRPGAIWGMSRAEAFALTAQSRAAARAYAMYDRLVPKGACVGAVFRNNDPSYPLYDAGLTRRVVYLSSDDPAAHAEDRRLSWVVVGPRMSASSFERVRRWRIHRLSGYWTVAERDGRRATC
jgi:Glycosyltransferase family 87